MDAVRRRKLNRLDLPQLSLLANGYLPGPGRQDVTTHSSEAECGHKIRKRRRWRDSPLWKSPGRAQTGIIAMIPGVCSGSRHARRSSLAISVRARQVSADDS
ncbi:hypothetical protein BN2475_50107 [Paraburkholderia ribeironis]|uniref:Uncharacterized protein n=1 Tax=Paraburkholderia ribeironis TaxID=1247936 RepID=A0A1N7RKE4_9BURK|nr:hypothetical protein BN2475_50107 [Paraburkholderia ribeironis]